jgi:hypothetical protein
MALRKSQSVEKNGSKKKASPSENGLEKGQVSKKTAVRKRP